MGSTVEARSALFSDGGRAAQPPRTKARTIVKRGLVISCSCWVIPTPSNTIDPFKALETFKLIVRPRIRASSRLGTSELVFAIVLQGTAFALWPARPPQSQLDAGQRAYCSDERNGDEACRISDLHPQGATADSYDDSRPDVRRGHMWVEVRLLRTLRT